MRRVAEYEAREAAKAGAEAGGGDGEARSTQPAGEGEVPNAETRAAVAEVDDMVNTRAARLASADELFTELDEASDRTSKPDEQ